MYAVVRAGGRQYKVTPGESFSVEKIEGKPGSKIDLSEVLMVGGDKTVVGAPTVAGAKVSVVIVDQYRGKKIFVFKKKRRNNYDKQRGHRSELTRLFVEAIVSPAGNATTDKKPVVVNRDADKATKKVAKAAAAGVETKGAAKTAAPKKAPAKKTTTTKAKAKK
jgi:large subunit ribosomal protein L21